MRRLSLLIATSAALVAFLGLSAPAQAIPPVDLLTDFNLRIDGANDIDLAGHSVSYVGDVNGDGLDDVIVGASAADNNGRRDSGSVYVIFGDPSRTGTIDLDNIGTPGHMEGFRIDGAQAGHNTGGWSSISDAGDVNGDGLDDMIIGVKLANYNGYWSGSAFVVFGKASNWNTVDLADIGTPGNAEGFRIDGVDQNDLAGKSVSGTGDVSGDGYDDVIVGARLVANNGRQASGSAYIVFGDPNRTGTIDLADIGTPDNEEGFRIDGARAGDEAGLSVSGAGDVNGDNIPDVIVGAPGADNIGLSSGSAYVVFGKVSNWNTVDLADIGTPDNAEGFRIDGASRGDEAGWSVSGAGDINGDNIPDVIVGAPRAWYSFLCDTGIA